MIKNCDLLETGEEFKTQSLVETSPNDKGWKDRPQTNFPLRCMYRDMIKLENPVLTFFKFEKFSNSF